MQYFFKKYLENFLFMLDNFRTMRYYNFRTCT
nr:MAG TPA: hypothetical protein [Caudoviricetes sp.]